MRRTAIAPGKPPRRKTRINPLGAKARREAPSLAEFRRAVRERAGGLCELGTPACPPGAHEGHHAHHRRLRSQGGGHEAENGLWLCSESHRYLHANPEYAYSVGGMLRATDTRDELERFPHGHCHCGAALDHRGVCEDGASCARDSWEQGR